MPRHSCLSRKAGRESAGDGEGPRARSELTADRRAAQFRGAALPKMPQSWIGWRDHACGDDVAHAGGLSLLSTRMGRVRRGVEVRARAAPVPGSERTGASPDRATRGAGCRHALARLRRRGALALGGRRLRSERRHDRAPGGPAERQPARHDHPRAVRAAALASLLEGVARAGAVLEREERRGRGLHPGRVDRAGLGLLRLDPVVGLGEARRLAIGRLRGTRSSRAGSFVRWASFSRPSVSGPSGSPEAWTGRSSCTDATRVLSSARAWRTIAARMLLPISTTLIFLHAPAGSYTVQLGSLDRAHVTAEFRPAPAELFMNTSAVSLADGFASFLHDLKASGADGREVVLTRNGARWRVPDAAGQSLRVQ